MRPSLALAASAFAVASAILAVTSPAPAQSNLAPPPVSPPPPPPVEVPGHVASITFSPIHLLFPIVEVTAEVALPPKFGVAAIFGYGTIPLTTSGRETERLEAWEVGGHFNYYVVGSFDHGMQLGLEGQYLHVARSTANSGSVAASAEGFVIGPYVGYKIITRPGFTFEANLGVEYVAAQAKASDGSSSAQASEKRVIPLLNLNIGWSF